MSHQFSACNDYSELYREKLERAINEARTLYFPNKTRVSPTVKVDEERLSFVKDYMWQKFYPSMYKILPTYWGNQCQTLASHAFAHLVMHGFDADIVVGEVEVNGTLEFDATLESIRREYSGENLVGNQAIHVWVTIGDDTVIDAGLPDRMIKHYKFPENLMPPIIVGRAGKIAQDFRAKHEPLLVGTDFVAKTNSIDPLDLAEKLSKFGLR